MALVDYTSSDDGDKEVESTIATDTSTSQSLKRKRAESSSDLPPLPSKFHDLYASTTRVSTRDDPSLHGGRKRVMPHVEGNWPTHLYIEWYPSTTEYASLNALVSSLKAYTLPEATNLRAQSFLTSDLGTPLPLHISLSRPIGLSTEQKDDFVASLDRAIKSSAIRPFDVSFTCLDWVPNFENTRWFLVLRLQKPDLDGLNKLLYTSNAVVQEYSQPPLYAKPTQSNVKYRTKFESRKVATKKTASPWIDMEDFSTAFHISIAWTLAAPSPELLELTKSLTSNNFDKIKQIRVAVEEIKAKVGNIVTNMPLPKSITLRTSLFGA
ncbi:hypothetical protein EG329_004728 [Mollisiaceae sp. DMI_Dod_QoI]|nr:hypothetical protein EG329_004728 [Helotiales sp. DMI_Dod_QoI]